MKIFFSMVVIVTVTGACVGKKMFTLSDGWSDNEGQPVYCLSSTGEWTSAEGNNYEFNRSEGTLILAFSTAFLFSGKLHTINAEYVYEMTHNTFIRMFSGIPQGNRTYNIESGYYVDPEKKKVAFLSTHSKADTEATLAQIAILGITSATFWVKFEFGRGIKQSFYAVGDYTYNKDGFSLPFRLDPVQSAGDAHWQFKNYKPCPNGDCKGVRGLVEVDLVDTSDPPQMVKKIHCESPYDVVGSGLLGPS